MNTFLSPRMMFGAAIVGLVGAAGVFIYEQVYNEKRRAMLVREMARLDKQVSSMRTELEALRELQKETSARQKQKRRPRPRPAPKPAAAGDADTVDARDQSYASDSEYFTDYQSVLGTDAEADSEEFYDVHTDEEDTLRESLRNGHDDLDEDEPDNTDTRPADGASNASTVTLTDKPRVN